MTEPPKKGTKPKGGGLLSRIGSAIGGLFGR